jgi:hypothetical protein
LPCDTGPGEIFTVLGNGETDFFRQACDFGIQLFAAPLETELLGARFAERVARFVGAGINLADRLFDDRHLVAALGGIDGLAGDGGEKPPHTCQNAFVKHGLLLRLC